MSLSSKDRVLCALAHEEPDRVPINYMANPGIDRRIKEHYGLDADDHEGLRQVLGVDFRGTFAPYVGPPLHAEVPGCRVDPWGIRSRWIEHEAGGYWDFCDFPLREATAEEVEDWPMPSPDDFDYSHVKDFCHRYGRYGLFAGGQGVACVINRGAKLRGMEQILMDLATDEPAGLLLIERKQNIELDITSRVIEASHGAFDFLWMGEDLGSQIAPMISLQLYRKHIRPQHQKFVDLAKAHDLLVMVHTCGCSSWAYEDFIDMGIDVVETLQPEAKDMSPRYLKETFGTRLAFHGCISTAGAVSFGGPDDVEQEVRDTLAVMMPGGGYCLSPSHLLQDNTPTENAVALYEHAHTHGRYPL